MKTIYFVRHGESESNANDIMSGGANDIPLTPKGKRQAKKAGQELKNKNIELIVCSPLIRTVDTATIIANEVGYNPKLILKNPILIERQLGFYEGKPREEYLKAYSEGKLHSSVESEEQIVKRFKKALAWLNSLKQNRIVVVSHGGARRAVHVINHNLHHSHMYKLDSFGNGEIYEFKL